MSDRRLAEAIYHELTGEEAIDAALEIWDHARIQCPHWSDRKRFEHLLPLVAAHVFDRVLARRQREAARTGPWDGTP